MSTESKNKTATPRSSAIVRLDLPLTMTPPKATPEASMTYSQGYDQALLDMMENKIRHPSPGWSHEYTDGYIAGEEFVLLERAAQREPNDQTQQPHRA